MIKCQQGVLLKLQNLIQSTTKLQMSSTPVVVTDDVVLEKVNHVGCITLNRPKQLNALNLSMVQKIIPKLNEWQNDSSVSMILIRGSGNTAFCAGGDIKAIRESVVKTGSVQAALDFFKNEYILNYQISQCKKPYVALIHGVTMGGGVGLSVHGRYRIATEKTLFAMPETAIGLFPDVGGTYALARLSGKLGLYLGLTGSRLKGKEVYDVGIATHYIQSEQIGALTDELLKTTNPSDLQNVIEAFNKQPRDTYNTDLIDNVFDASTIEGVLKNLENENSEWSRQQLSILSKMCPTSLKVTFKYINMAGQMSLKQVLQTDYALGKWCVNGTVDDNNLFEGVRALLVDKDNKPKWRPATLQEVSDETINQYFQLNNDGDNLVLN